jgi:uncharacterized protein YodC (DUF2158 family)
MEVFPVGELVCLKSGGMVMTVAGVPGEDTRICVWMDTTGACLRGRFPVKVLVPFNEPYTMVPGIPLRKVL